MIPEPNNNDSTPLSPAMKELFGEAVRAFIKPASAKYQMLDELKDGISDLRRKGASYREISKILEGIGVSVSYETLSKYCKNSLKLSGKPAKRRSPIVKQEEELEPELTPPPVLEPSAALCEGPFFRRRRGPRIADPKNL